MSGFYLDAETIETLTRAAKQDGQAPTYRACNVSQTTFCRALMGNGCSDFTHQQLTEYARKWREKQP